MGQQHPDWQGTAWAAVYDEHYPALDLGAPLIDFLCRTYPEGAELLELGVGTGRVALPLARAGRKVSGVDISDHMLEQLRRKDTDRLMQDVLLASITDLELGRTFDGVFSVFNTFFALASQDEQLAALRVAATHTRPGGKVVIENSNPVLTTTGFTHNQIWAVKEILEDQVYVMAGRHEPSRQRIQIRHLFLKDNATEALPTDVRYIWPAELLLMGQLAGLELEATYGFWDESPYMDQSPSFIAVFRQRE